MRLGVSEQWANVRRWAGEARGSAAQGDTAHKQLWESRKLPARKPLGRERRAAVWATSPAGPLPAAQARGLTAPAKSRTNFSWKVGDVVLGQIQNSHGPEQLNIRRNDLNQGVVYVPFFQVRLLLQRIRELLKQMKDSVRPRSPNRRSEWRRAKAAAQCVPVSPSPSARTFCWQTSAAALH